MVAAFRQGLKETGYVEGQNVAVEYRWMAGQYSRYPEVVTELLRLPLSAIYVNGPVGVWAVRAATATLPIVFVMGEDPITEGIVERLNRPGGNVTGFSDFANQLVSKRVSLLCDAVPGAGVVAVLANPTHRDAESEIRDARTAGNMRGRDMRVMMASTDADLEPAFESMVRQRVGALIVLTDPFFNGRGIEIARLAQRSALPAIYDPREIVIAGGLMSYGTDRVHSRRQAGRYVGRILKGEKPADLPVQRSTKFDFVINLKTAKTLGLEFSAGPPRHRRRGCRMSPCEPLRSIAATSATGQSRRSGIDGNVRIGRQRTISCRGGGAGHRAVGHVRTGRAAAAAANWAPSEPAHAHPNDGDIAVGWGVGLGTHHVSYGAAVAQIEINRRTGNIVAKRLFGALDAGLTVNPALVERTKSSA
jgi:putative ABC transport system substrate-binding protein